MGTRSVNHRASTVRFFHSQKLVGGMDRASLASREPGRIAIAVAFQTGRVIAFVLGISQGFGFWGSQLCVVTSRFATLAGREIALVFRISRLPSLHGSKLGVVALVPSVLTILRVALVLRRGSVFGLRRS